MILNPNTFLYSQFVLILPKRVYIHCMEYWNFFFWEKQNFRKKIGLKTKKKNYLESSGNIENTKQARHLANILLFVLIPSFLIPIAPSKPSPHPSL